MNIASTWLIGEEDDEMVLPEDLSDSSEDLYEAELRNELSASKPVQYQQPRWWFERE